MPHAFVRSIKKPITRVTTGEFSLIENFSFARYDLSFVSLRGESFALSIRPKDGLFLVKPEKLSRPANLNLVKEAIAIFCAEFCGEIVSSNIALKKEKEKSSNLLDPLYFSEHPEFFDVECAVEVGFGSGRHLLFRAAEEPNKKFIGIEIYKPSIEQVLRRAELLGLTNVYVVDFDARLVIESMKKGSISEIYVHFPVPWPNSPTRRVISASFLQVCSKALKEGGFVELRSDDKDYFEYALTEALSLEKVRFEASKNEPALIVSKYEDRWLRKGKDIFETRIYPESGFEPLEEGEEEGSFEFDGELSLIAAQSVVRESFIKDGVLINFEDFALSADGANMTIKATFGDPARPDRRYITSINGEAFYFPHPPLCVRSAKKAHKIIKECLYGKSS